MSIFSLFKRKKKIELIKLNEQIEFSNIEKEFPSVFPKKKLKYAQKCQFDNCKANINEFSRYVCNYCHNSFCEKHRLPEEHNCRNPKLPLYMKTTGQKTHYESDKENRRLERE